MAGVTAASAKSIGRAMSAYNSGNLAEAEQLCRKIIGSDAQLLRGAAFAGRRASRAGPEEKAIANYDRAISLRPRDAALFSNRGVVLKDLKRFDEALASFDRALAIDPRLAGAHSNRGNALRALERYDEALASYDRALAIRPNDARAIHNRGVALYRLGQFEDALSKSREGCCAEARLRGGMGGPWHLASRDEALQRSSGELRQGDCALATHCRVPRPSSQCSLEAGAIRRSSRELRPRDRAETRARGAPRQSRSHPSCDEPPRRSTRQL